MKIFFLLVSLVFICTGVNAQAQADIASMEVKFKRHIKSLNPADTSNSGCDIVYTVVMNDTAKVKNIYINAGKENGGGDIFNFSFKLDDKKDDLPPGLSCQRIGNTLVITVADIVLHADYYYQVKVEDKSGKISVPKTYRYK